jgi:hypothetical protein
MSKPIRNEKTLKIDRYNHGGARIYFEDGDDLELVADTYQETDREIIFEVIKATVAAQPAESADPDATKTALADALKCWEADKTRAALADSAQEGDNEAD